MLDPSDKHGRIKEIFVYNATTYAIREETMEELLAEGLTRESSSPEIKTTYAETDAPARQHHTQRYLVRFEENLTIDEQNNLERIPKDENFVGRGRVEIGENEFTKFEKRKED
jgi:hypothetical protein